MSAQEPLQESGRRTLKRWTIQRCPECHGMVQGSTVEHLGDCLNRERAFVVEMIDVVPLSVAEALAGALERISATNGVFYGVGGVAAEAVVRFRAAYPKPEETT